MTGIDNSTAIDVDSDQDGIEELKSYGMVEDEGRVDLGKRIARAIGTEGIVRGWTMPDHLVGRDGSGRLILVGNPRSNYELAERIARVFDKEIVWATIGDTKLKYNGAYLQKDGIIVIDPRSHVTAASVLGHELSHHLETAHPDIYQELFDNLEPMLTGCDEYRQRLSLGGKTDLHIQKEIIADLMGDSFAEPSFWDDVAVQMGGSKFKKLAQAVMRWIASVVPALKRYSSFESAQFNKDLQKARATQIRISISPSSKYFRLIPSSSLCNAL